MRRWVLTASLALCGLALPGAEGASVTVGSKSFTENVILGDVVKLLIESTGADCTHIRGLGGTRVLFNALVAGEIDAYVEYSGTLTQEILREQDLTTPEQIAAALAERGIQVSSSLGFNNGYALGMTEETASRRQIVRISDLRAHSDLRLGLSNEFMDRGDGWPGLSRHYGLTHPDVRGIDHDVAYRALDSGDLDVIDLYTTDAEIAYYGLRILEDDRKFFRRYDAVLLYRDDLNTRAPAAVRTLSRLDGAIDEALMQAMNVAVKVERQDAAVVAAAFVEAELGLETRVSTSSVVDRLLLRTREHLLLVLAAMTAGLLVAIPLGIAAAKLPRAGGLILGAVGVLQTIPALALLVLMIPLLGIAEPPAIAALFLYSLLPMVRNTHAGICGISPAIEESAEALGLSAGVRLWRIELPLASPSILAGVKTSTVIVIGFATLGALIGAGGYGQPIFTGIRLDDFGLILEGAIPSALLALLAQAGFGVAERFLVPRGLRLR